MKYMISILLCLPTAYAQDLPVFKKGEELRAADLMTLVSEIEALRSEVELLKEQIEVAKSSNPSGKIKVPPLKSNAHSVANLFVSVHSARFNNKKLVVDVIVRSQKDQEVRFNNPTIYDSNGNTWKVQRKKLFAGNMFGYDWFVDHMLVQDIDTKVRCIVERVQLKPDFVARMDLSFVINGTSEKLILKDIPVEGS